MPQLFSSEPRCLSLLLSFSLVFVCWVKPAPAQQIVEDFESGLSESWEATGTAFESPVVRAADLQVTGYRGRFLLNSFAAGDSATGRLSRTIELDQPFLNFLIAGGSHPEQAYVALVVDDQVVQSATGNQSGNLRWESWDVQAWQGKQATLRIVDEATGPWGHLNVDHIELSSQRRTGTGRWRLEEYRKSFDYYRETHRPGFHFTPELNWMNDPNGLVYHKGTFHLFYQYNPLGMEWGHMSWGHATSKDLLHWEHKPVAIRDTYQEMAFSGSAVFDRDNSSQLGTAESPPLVAIYTGHGDGRQTQNLAYSLDDGTTWTRYSGNPVLDLGEADFRDPKVFWYAPKQKWIMVVSLATRKIVQFYGSTDLKTWQHLSDFGPAGTSEKANWECPDLFELQIDGETETRWVLEVDMGSGAIAGGSGGEYFVGQFDGTQFVPESEKSQWVDFGRDFYAPISWNNLPNSDGRRIWIGWMNNWETCLVPTYPWRSSMSIPRQLKLVRIGERLQLAQQPIDELNLSRIKSIPIDFTLLDSKEAVTSVGQQLDLTLNWKPGDQGSSGIRVLKSGDSYTEIGFDAQRSEFYLDRRKSGKTDFHTAFAGRHAVHFDPHRSPFRIRVIVDQSSVEVFLDQGQVVMTDLVFPLENANTIEFFATEATTRFEGHIHQIESTMGKTE